MPRSDVFKRIKDDILIENRIQIYRVHFTYLKTCLKYPKGLSTQEKDFKVDKSKYNGWNLDLVKSLTFDKWWNKVGRDLFGKKLKSVRQIKTTSFNPRPNTIVVELPKDNPTEYNIEKIRTILNQYQTKTKKEKRIHHLKLEIYLESWNIRRQQKIVKLYEIADALKKKRLRLLEQRGSNRVAMDKTAFGKFLSMENVSLEVNELGLERQINRFNKKAERVLYSVCNGVFPGDYTDD